MTSWQHMPSDIFDNIRLIDSCHQAITWSNINISSMQLCQIHMRVMSQEMLHISVSTYQSLKCVSKNISKMSTMSPRGQWLIISGVLWHSFEGNFVWHPWYEFENYQFDGLVQDCSNCIANALELLQCTKPLNSRWQMHHPGANQLVCNSPNSTSWWLLILLWLFMTICTQCPFSNISS